MAGAITAAPTLPQGLNSLAAPPPIDVQINQLGDILKQAQVVLERIQGNPISTDLSKGEPIGVSAGLEACQNTANSIIVTVNRLSDRIGVL